MWCWPHFVSIVPCSCFYLYQCYKFALFTAALVPALVLYFYDNVNKFFLSSYNYGVCLSLWCAVFFFINLFICIQFNIYCLFGLIILFQFSYVIGVLCECCCNFFLCHLFAVQWERRQRKMHCIVVIYVYFIQLVANVSRKWKKEK